MSVIIPPNEVSITSGGPSFTYTCTVQHILVKDNPELLKNLYAR